MQGKYVMLETSLVTRLHTVALVLKPI